MLWEVGKDDLAVSDMSFGFRTLHVMLDARLPDRDESRAAGPLTSISMDTHKSRRPLLAAAEKIPKNTSTPASSPSNGTSHPSSLGCLPLSSA